MLRISPANRFNLFRHLTLLSLLLGSQIAWSISVTPTTSTNGSYTVSWSAPTGTYTYPECYPIPEPPGYYCADVSEVYVLQENNGSGWVNASTDQGATSKSYSGKANGTYQYQIYYSYYGGSYPVEGPVSVTVNTTPTFSIGDASISEGGALSFTVTRNGAASGSFSVNYATANGTAVAGSDYTATSGTLTFANNETTKTIPVTTIQENVFEPNETLYVNLSAPSGGATITDGQGLGAINNDDAADPHADTDGDGVKDGPVYVPIGVSDIMIFIPVSDNCRTTPNSDQSNSDSDAYGNACDDDDDNDGHLDVADAFPTNPTEWADSDGDGMGDNSDIYLNDPNRTVTASFNGVPSPVAPIDKTEAVVPGNEVTATDTVGTVAGSFRVNESGAATYSIPIATVPGTAGVVPQMSLNYSSQAGNGLVGVGWSIGGLSGISRCRQTLAQDNIAKPITWSTEDRFCLDGQRLLAVIGTYGAVGAVYKTEIDSFATITSVGGSVGHPNYFTVERKDGSISYYGNTTDAKLLAGTNVYVWAMNRFQDSVGNGIDFVYANDANGHRIAEVRYAYGSTSVPEAKLVFSYDTTSRQDPIKGYVAGYLFETKARLNKIDVYNNFNGSYSAIRTYNLAYRSLTGATNKLSRLESVQECVGTACLPATTFNWTMSQLGFAGSAQTTNITAGAMGNWRPADINGDGLLDVVWEKIVIDDCRFYHYLRVSTSNGTTLSDTGFEHYLGYTDRYVSHPKDYRGWSLIDYNGDGRQDIIVFGDFYANTKNPRILLSTPQSDGSWRISGAAINVGFAVESNDYITPVVVDVDSDGMADLLYSILNTTQNTYEHYIRYLKRNTQPDGSSTAYSFSNAQLLTVNSNVDIDPYSAYGDMTMAGLNFVDSGNILDINGDGRAEILANVHYFDGTWDWPALQLLTINGSSLDLAAPVALSSESKFSDINGDGLTDYITLVNYTWSFALNTGSGFTTPQAIPGISGSYPENYPEIQVVDYNYDGNPDVVWQQGDYPDTNDNDALKVNLWNGSGYDSPIVIKYGLPDSNNENNPVSNIMMDMNGDGRSDYVQVKTGTTATFKVFANLDQGSGPGLITAIANGLGAQTDIFYEALGRSDHYERVTVGTEPQVFTWDGEPYTYPYSDTTGFYTALNGSWDLPDGSQTFGKDEPVLELTGPIYVVTDVQSDAPAAGATPGNVDANALSSISYYYGEAKIQAVGRGFLGFHKLQTIDNQTGVDTTTTYRQDYPFVGYPLTTEVRSLTGHLLSKSTNTWKLQGYQSSWAATAAAQGSATLGPLQPYLDTAEEETYDLINNGASAGGLLSRVITVTTNDSYGNPTSISVLTEDEVNNKNFRKTTTNLYGGTPWEQEKGRLSRTTVVNQRDEDGNGAYELSATRVSGFTYYTSGTLKGLLQTETIEPDNAAYTLTTTYSYDSFGNKVRAKITGGAETRCDFDTADYDAKGRYVDETYDCLGRLTSQVLSRNNLGQPLSVKSFIDINGVSGVTATYAYTPRGIKYFERGVTGAYATSTLRPCGAGDTCPASAAYLAEAKTAGGGQSREYFDKLGRSVRKATLGFNGAWNFSDTEYDNLGRVKRQSEPYIQGGVSYWTILSYDILGRVTYTTLPDYVAVTNNSDVEITYSGYTSTTVNAQGQQKVETRNALGEMLLVRDHLNGTVAYGYDAQGNLKTTTVQAADVATPVTTTINYDLLGRKENMSDLDKGSWGYDYNHFGELIRQDDAKSQYSVMTYDGFGRMKTRKDYFANGVMETNNEWFYDSAANGLGQLASVSDTLSGYTKAITYDSYGRPSVSTTTLGSDGAYYEKQTYDGYGRPFQSFDAARPGQTWTDNVVETVYNAYGYAERLIDGVYVNGVPRRTYQQITNMDARGNVRNETLGGGAASTVRNIAEATGRLNSIVSTDAISGDIQELSYDWDNLGNLEYRRDYSGAKNLEEIFGYDALNRLTSYQITGQAARTVQYDGLGNIQYKSDVGNYHYAQEGVGGCAHFIGPHAVNCAGGVTYTYDANGNNTSSTDGRAISYTTFDQASVITKNAHTTRFYYGPDRGRYKRTDNDIGGTVTTLYLGQVEKIIQPGGNYQYKRYIGGMVIETEFYTSANAQTAEERHLVFRDLLGSLDVLAEWADNGVLTIAQVMSFDAFGQRRDAGDWLGLSQVELDYFDHGRTTRGFTNHEMADEVGIIHMNGRIYDPKLGRFLQADPFVQDATFLQSYNRYSYGFNNPLNGTDPSGYLFGIDDILIAFAVGAIIGEIGRIADIPILQAIGTAVSCIGGNPALCGAAAFGSALGYTHDFKSAFQAGTFAMISAAAFSAIPGLELGPVGDVIAHGTVGGVMSVLQGGKFGHGFISAGLTKAIGINNFIPGVGAGKDVIRVVAAAMVGGTISEITGDKFANGAITAAFAQAFNGNSEFKLEEIKVTAKYRLPLADTLSDNYPPPNPDGSPAHPSADPHRNQCAIRTGVSLEYSGFNLDSYPGVNKTSEGWPRSSKNLADWLWQKVGRPLIVSPETFRNKYYSTFKGIAYFAPPPGKEVGHIDVWNANRTPPYGSGYYTSSEVWLFKSE